MQTSASLLGVGTPEVLVIGVVALLVFGPKGLADAARGLGKTLRSFQPTIKELKEVSEEFKSTLEDEIGLDELKASYTGTGPPRRPYTAKDEAGDPDIDKLRQASAAAAWGGSEADAEAKPEAFAETLEAPAASESAAADDDAGAEAGTLGDISLEELQAEIERRKGA